MTKKETAHVLAIMQMNYPDTFKGKSEDVLQGMVDLWQTCFAEEPVELVMEAVKAHMITSTDRYMPQIGVIREKLHSLTRPHQLSEAEAWALVMKAVRNGNYGFHEEFAKLPPIVQRCVGTENTIREWAQMDSETLNSVIASNFQRAYRVISQNEAELTKLPSGMRERIAQLTEQVFGRIDGGSENTSLLPKGGPRQ